MKILFISSGYSGIYPYFEQSIQDSLSHLNHTVLKITPEYSLATSEQIDSFQPDFVFVFVGYKMKKDLIEYLKQKGYVLGIWFTEDPYYIDESIRLVEDFHYIFTIDLGAYHYYKQAFQSKNIYHLPLGTDPDIYFPSDNPGNTIYDVCLIGYPYPERIQLIQHILDHTPYTLILAGPLWRKFISGYSPKRLTIINKWVEPEIGRIIFHSSKIILNPHRTYHFHKNKNSLGIESKSINNRTFDIAACRGFQLITKKSDIEMHFGHAKELISYSTNEECIQLIHQFVKDEQARIHYSQRAMEKVLKCHTFSHRVQLIINLLEKREGG